MKTTVWKEGTKGEPKFPTNFKVVKKAVLQATDIKTNKNKYYALELHSAKNQFRVYTHYGRTDDLATNPNAGVKECRYFNYQCDAEDTYDKIYKEKTSPRKGYKELNLAAAKIGSSKSIGQSSGSVDDKTLHKIKKRSQSEVEDEAPTVAISKEIQRLVDHLYSEATKTLTKKVNATITANGIETPLGVLTIGQIDKGENILEDIATAIKKKKSVADLTKLSSEFYTVIPHKVGRNKQDILDAVITTSSKIEEKQDTLQLMRDMLNVSSKGKNILANPQVEKQYLALGCEIDHLDKNSSDFKKIKKYVNGSKNYGSVGIKNIFTVKRSQEHKDFDNSLGNQKLLFHGSGAHNWVGILSRGLMLPKMVTKLGVQRTDAGWLGHGIYFGDSIDTAYNYAGYGKLDSIFIAIATVALGKMKKYTKITYGLTKPPIGYNSCHGDPDSGDWSEFEDHEFVIYDTKQQRLEYLLEVE